MDNTSLIKLIKRRVFRGKKHVIRLSLVRLGGRDYRQTRSKEGLKMLATILKRPIYRIRGVSNARRGIRTRFQVEDP